MLEEANLLVVGGRWVRLLGESDWEAGIVHEEAHQATTTRSLNRLKQNKQNQLAGLVVVAILTQEDT